MWERQTFVCCYQSLFGSGNAEHVTLPPDPRARDGSGDRAGYVLVPDEPEPKYGPHAILGCPPCRRGNLHPLLGATPKALPRARHLLEPTQMTGLLSPRPRTQGCILGNSASALPRKSTSQTTSWHFAPPLCKNQTTEAHKERKESKSSREEGAPKREATPVGC